MNLKKISDAFHEERSESEVKSSFNDEIKSVELRPANVFFRKLVRAIPTGLTVTTLEGDTPADRAYKVSNGDENNVSVRYKVDYKGKSDVIRVTNVPGKRGRTEGYLLEYLFYKTWAGAKQAIKFRLKEIGINASEYGL